MDNNFLPNLNETWDKIEVPKKVIEFGIESIDTKLFIKETLDLRAALE